jgi:hypothetical protein
VRQTYAPIYGEKHYLLASRLNYAGYQQGGIADESAVIAACTAAKQRAVPRPRKNRPQSKKIVETITLYNPWVQIQKIRSEWYVWTANHRSDAMPRSEKLQLKRDFYRALNAWHRENSWSRGPEPVYPYRDMSGEGIRRKNALQSAKHLHAQWVKHCAMAGAPTSAVSVVRQIVKLEKAKKFTFRPEEKKEIKTTLYLDSIRAWIEVSITQPAGYYPA